MRKKYNKKHLIENTITKGQGIEQNGMQLIMEVSR